MSYDHPNELLHNLTSQCQILTSPCGEGKIVWRQWGSENTEKPPVIMLHGGFGAWNHWVKNIPELADKYKLLVVDLPGCGDSSDPPRPYDAQSLVALISEGIDTILPQNTPFELVSFSFGGVLSGLIAHAQSRRIKRLTLVGAPVLGLTGTGPANDLIAVPRDHPLDKAAPIHRKNLEKMMVHNPEAVDNLALTLHMQNMAKARLRSRGIARGSVLADSLHGLPCRLACIFGEKDVTLYPDLQTNKEYVHELYPDAPFYIIQNVGHWVQYEAYNLVNTILLELLE